MHLYVITFICILLTSCIPFQEVKTTNEHSENDNEISTRIIGTWDRKNIDNTKVNDEFVRSTTKSTAFISHSKGTGTGLYIGKLEDSHLLITSAHVLNVNNKLVCRNNLFISIDNNPAKCIRILTHQKQNDVAILEIKFINKEIEQSSHKFKTKFQRNEKLINIGYATKNSKLQGLTMNNDEYCRVFSNGIKQLEVKDIRVWSMAVGCDSSPGNSGSVVVNRLSGEILGVIWGVGQRKEKELQNKVFLEHLLISTDHSVWKYLTYATPSLKIKEQLIQDLDGSIFNREDSILIEALLNQFI